MVELKAIVGEHWVFADDANVTSYRKSFVPDPAKAHVPAGAVAPASVEEIQAVVKVANKYRLPRWPVSTGKNMGYGQATTATPGQVVLDLKRMNRLLRVDIALATALVEGVLLISLPKVMAWTPLLSTASVVPKWKCQATT